MGGRPIEKIGEFFVDRVTGGKILWEETDTRSQVETMTNEAMGGWETSNRQMYHLAFCSICVKQFQ